MFGRSLLRRIGAYVVPVWDYALMTEPLSDAQLAALGWNGPRGAGDMSNQFHYFRLTRDNRMLWGGYDAVYYNGGRIRDEHAYSPATFAKLAEQFFTAFPQLEGVSFTHAWGGVIDTCSRFCAFFGTAYGGRLGYVAGYTGLGVGATRFGAQVLLDKIENRRFRTDPAGSGPLQADAFPAGAAQVRGDPADQGVDRPGGRERGTSRRLAAPAGPRWAGVRLVAVIPARSRRVAGLGPPRHGHHKISGTI